MIGAYSYVLTLLLLNGGPLLHNYRLNYLSRVMRKPTFCICENKDAEELHGNHEADQRLSFRYTDSTIPILYKTEISSL